MSQIRDERATEFRGRARSTLPRILWLGTGALGLVAWAVGLTGASPARAGTLSVLAGAVAVLGLVPGQVPRGWLAAAVAITASADAVTATVAGGEPSAMSLVVNVVVALQALVAVAALVLGERGSAVRHSGPEDDYAAYARYVQAYQDYAQRYGASWPDRQSVTVEADATAHADAAADRDAWADLQATYTRHLSPVAPATPEHQPRQADGARRDAGVPGINRVDRPPATGPAAPGSAPTSPVA